MTAKDLKNAILQEAVQGKLVPQIASEGSARDLLEQIKAEKAKLVKEGKIKKEKPFPEITEEEIPFDIPESWCWCRIGEIYNLQAGKTISASEISETSNGNDYLCYGGNGIRGYVKTYNREGYYPLIGRQGALCGNINFANGKFYATEHAVVVETFANTNVNWAGLFLSALNLNRYATATAQPGLAVRNINEVFIPLPPLSEQKRIVEAIEKFMPLIEEYGKKESVLKDLNANIGTLTKKAILQEAVQGKLVPQIASEGNAKDLLEQIKAEKAKLVKEGKIKKEKPLPEITEDEIPFDIPESWCWCRLGEIVKDFLVPQRDKPKFFDGNIPWCRIEDIEGMYLNGTHSDKYVSRETVKSMNLKINPIGTVISANSASIGAAAITTVECCTNQTFIGLVCSDILYNYYLYYFLKAITDKLKRMGTGTTISYISQDKYKEMLFPLPPLSEQKRIVEAIENLLPYCEKLGRE